MQRLVSELEREPVQGEDGLEEEEEEEREAALSAGRQLGDIAMFAQPDALSDSLQSVYEADDGLRRQTVRAQRRAAAAAAGAFHIAPPQPITDLDDLDNAQEAAPASPPAAEPAASSPGAGASRPASPSDAQHAANVAALVAHPAKKKRDGGAGFAFSSARALDSGSRAAPGIAAASAAALPRSGTEPSSGAPTTADAFSSAVGASFAAGTAAPAASSASPPAASGCIASSLPKGCTASPLSPDSSLVFYYYDAYEEPSKSAGTVFLFGKALLPSLSASASCVLQVRNIQRNLYLLPRQYLLLNADDESSVTDQPVSMKDVYDELRQLMHDYGVRQFKVKAVRRSYCFDRELPADQPAAASLLDGENGVPASASYLKLVYPFTDRALPRSLTGRSFSRVFGCRSSALELLLLKRELMGPAWLSVSGISRVDAPLSWCRFEYRVDSQKDIRHCGDEAPPEPPLFSLLSISMRAVRSDKTGRDELVMISLLQHAAVSLDSAAVDGSESSLTVETAVVPQSGRQLPSDWPLAVKAHNRKRAARQLVQCANERAMLGWLLARVGNLDPDVLLSHELQHSGLDLLMARMQQLKVPHWSKLGRLKKTHFPSGLSAPDSQQAAAGLHHGSSLLDRGVGAGRLMLDTQLMAREFLLGQRMYTLSFLAASQLRIGERDEVEPAAVPQLLTRSADLLRLSAMTEADCFLAFSLACHLQLLPLTKQLTCLSGGCWSRTLRSVRSERVEWLLLHHFHSIKFITPCKSTAAENRDRQARGAARAAGIRQQPPADADGGTAPTGDGGEEGRAGGKRKERTAAAAASSSSSSRRRGKPLYSGGLVLEPKRGFYDKFVLLLDFNSLYPSIIQEFNICFTTVSHWRFTHSASKQQQPAGADAAAAAAAARSRLSPPEAMEDDGEAGDGVAAEAVALSSAIPLPAASAPHGELPRVIARLVARRREVKKLLQRETDSGRRGQLDIRQKALKLVANSMYGCLGFVNSRFYCAPLAALITSQGREILSSSVDACTAIGANVIYGDTDSLMIDTGSASMEAALQLGQSLRKEINRRHSVLELDIDGVYRNMLLLRKKKYAALRVADDGRGGRQEVREVKGLDLVRRDWCLLSKDLGNAVLNSLLSGRSREEIVSQVLTALDEAQRAVRSNAVHLDKFVITKSLTRHPSEYSDAGSQPHVQVALAMLARGERVRSGDIVPYVVCAGDGPIARRCYHPSTVIAASGGLSVDSGWYLSNQLLPPVVRLCGVMDELDASRIAHALGLDARHFRHHDDGRQAAARDREDEEEELQALSSVCVEQEQRFAHCSPLSILCPLCQQQLAFSGAVSCSADADTNEAEEKDGQRAEAREAAAAAPSSVARSGFSCPTAGCAGLLGEVGDERSGSRALDSIRCAVLLHYRAALLAFYSASRECSDSSCRLSTRDTAAHPRDRCLRERCQGQPLSLCSASSLYLTLQHLLFMFDPQQQTDKANRAQRRRHEEAEAARTAVEARGVDAAAAAASPPSLSPPPALSPSALLSRRELSICQSVQSLVTGLLQSSSYHFVSEQTFDVDWHRPAAAAARLRAAGGRLPAAGAAEQAAAAARQMNTARLATSGRRRLGF